MPGTRHRTLAAVVVVSGMATVFQVRVAPIVAHAQAAPEAAVATGDQYTPVVASVFSTPRWFTGSDGQARLADELSVLNAFAVDVKLTGRDVLDGSDGAVTASFDSDDLAAMSSLLSG